MAHGGSCLVSAAGPRTVPWGLTTQSPRPTSTTYPALAANRLAWLVLLGLHKVRL